MLELEDVRGGYGKLEILQSASLRVPDGAIVGIIGPNGAGKSTLLKTAFGYLAPWAGRIALDGQPIAGRRPGAGGRPVRGDDRARQPGAGRLHRLARGETPRHRGRLRALPPLPRPPPAARRRTVRGRAAPARHRARPHRPPAPAAARRAVGRAGPAVHRPDLRDAGGAEPGRSRHADRRAKCGGDPGGGPPGVRAGPGAERLRRHAGRAARLRSDPPALFRRGRRGLMLESLLEFLIQGLVLGGLYALFAVGLSLIFGVLDVINVAHGEFFAIGGYLAFAAVVLLHLPGAVGVLGAAVGTFLLGLCVYPLLIAPLKRRLGGRPQGPLYLVLTLGLSTFLQSSLLAIAGGDYLRVPPQVSGILDLGVTAVSHQRLLVLAAAAVLLTALFAFLRFHPEGLAVRAVALNSDAAQAMGINLPRIFALTLALGVALAGVGGALMAPLFNVYPAVGFPLTIKAFAITILGGMGNPAGALVASFLVSIAESLSVMVIPSQWQNLIAFAVMIVMLLVRPRGLFGRAVSR